MRQQDMFNGSGHPFEAWSQMWLGAFGNAQKSAEPVTKNLATAQSEVASFASRRTQAWLDLPKQYAHCKAPQDFVQANMQFMQSTASDWTAASQRMMALWGVALPSSSPLATPRDHVTVPDGADARRVMDQNARPSDRTNDPNGRRAAA